MTMTGSHGIAVNPLGLYHGTAPSFNRVVQSHEDWTARGEGVDQESQQNVARLQAGPFRTIQNAMVIRKMLLQAQSHHAQRRGHRSFSWRKDRPNQQDFRMLPNSLREQARKRPQDGDIFVPQGMHRQPRGRVFAEAYPAFRQDSNEQSRAKCFTDIGIWRVSKARR